MGAAALRRAWAAETASGRARAAALPDRSVLRWTLIPAAALLAIALLLVLSGGYHAGFAALNGLFPLLPPRLWAVMSALGDTATALALLLFLLPGRWHLAWIGLIATLLGLAFTHGLKHSLDLPRPAGVLPPEAFHGLGDLAAGQSFPSGHSQTVLTLAAVAMLATASPVLRAALVATGLVLAGSRVPVGMHWPIDVLVGAAGGLLCVLLAAWLARRSLWGIGWLATALMTGLGVTAALMLVAGHPAAYPGAAPVMLPLGAAALIRTARSGIAAARGPA
ncbi:MAG: phosphatase PAP2 family protein [Rhodobacteraceae bacterium]|nr:phosphatase PAP2 family protein [Paracoccaceae bacterium]